MKTKNTPKVLEKEVGSYTAEQIYEVFALVLTVLEAGRDRQVMQKSLDVLKKEIIKRFKAGDAEMDRVVRASNTLSQIVIAAARREGIAQAKAQVRQAEINAIQRVLADVEAEEKINV